MSTTIEINERALPVLRRLMFDLQGDATRDAIGRGVVKLLQGHFRALPANARNFPSTGFWQRAAEATDYEIFPEGVRVNVNQTGVRQRYFGGPIHPTHRQRLAIPANAQAYGHTPAEFSHLKIARAFFSTDHAYTALALVPDNAGTSQPADSGSVFFWLVKSVRQIPDPNVLPGDDDVLVAVQNSLVGFLK